MRAGVQVVLQAGTGSCAGRYGQLCRQVRAVVQAGTGSGAGSGTGRGTQRCRQGGGAGWGREEAEGREEVGSEGRGVAGGCKRE